MILRTNPIPLLILLLVLSGTGIVFAGTSQNHFNIYVSGIKVGELDYAIDKKGYGYSVRAIIKSKGIVNVFANYHFDGAVVGRFYQDQYSPQKYLEKSDTGRRRTNKKMIYEKGIPVLTQSEERKPYWLEPQSQRNTVDPITAIYALLSDQPQKNSCKQNIQVYDGARRFSVEVASTTKDELGMVCEGIFTRIGGYSEKELAQGTEFPFKLEYAAVGNVFRIKRFTMTTLRGRASFVRR